MVKLLALISVFIPLFLKGQEVDYGKIKLSVQSIYQQNDLQWSIAGNTEGQNPNIFSEVTWKNVEAPGFSAALKLVLLRKLFLKTTFTRTSVISGNATDIDYQEDNRTSQSFFAEVKSNKGFTGNYSVGLGYDVKFKDCKLSPAIAYTQSFQRFYLLDNKALKSSYQPVWKGVLTELNLNKKLFEKWELNLFLSYQQLGYKAKADWNLIESFAHPVSFVHKANGFGINYAFSMGRSLGKRFCLAATAQYQHWSTGKGIDQLFLSSGSTSFTQLNDVSQKRIQLGVGIDFLL